MCCTLICCRHCVVPLYKCQCSMVVVSPSLWMRSWSRQLQREYKEKDCLFQSTRTVRVTLWLNLTFAFLIGLRTSNDRCFLICYHGVKQWDRMFHISANTLDLQVEEHLCEWLSIWYEILMTWTVSPLPVTSSKVLNLLHVFSLIRGGAKEAACHICQPTVTVGWISVKQRPAILVFLRLSSETGYLSHNPT